jgi:FkbM family methyltransferase
MFERTVGSPELNLTATLRNLFSGAQCIESGEAAGVRIIARGADPDFVRGAYERPLQQLIASSLKAGDVFYDVGANIGFFSMIAALRVGPAGHVYAFEPVPRNATAIERSARLNGFQTISVFAEAVGAASGRDDLLLARHVGGAVLRSVGAPPDMIGRISVATTTIDDAIGKRGLRPPSLVKIDVEGAEMDVLTGMADTLRAYRPPVIYELDDASHAGLEKKARTAASFFASIGYCLTELPASYVNRNWQVKHVLAGPNLV